MLENAIGWFDVSFRVDPNHRYTFVLRKDGTILPDIIDPSDVAESDELIFAKFCSDPDLFQVTFFQNKPFVPEGHQWPKPPEKIK